jgi:sugar phosphate permease
MRFLSDWFPEGVRGRALGIYVGALELGNGLSFVFATVAAEAVDWRTAVAATSVGAIVVAPFVVGLTRDHPKQRVATTSGTGGSLLRDREFLAAVSIYSWHNWELFGVRNWLVAFFAVAPAFATSSSVLPGIVVGAMVITGALGNGLGGWVSDRLGRLRTISIGLGASGLLSALFGRFGGLPFAVLVAVTLVYGVVLAVDSAPTSTLVTEVVGDDRVGRALSIQSLVGFSTTVVSPVVFGIALGRAGYSAAFLTLAAGALLGVLSVGALRRTRGART